MGRTYKDQRKWDVRRGNRDENPIKEPRKTSRNKTNQVIPPDDELEPYEEYDYEDYQ